MKIDLEKIENLVQMLNSGDNENAITALSILDQQDPTDITMSLFIIGKESHRVTNDAWEKHAPNCKTYLESLDNDFLKKPITFGNILRLAKKANCSAEELQLLRNYFNKHLLTQMQMVGYDFIQEIDVTFTENYGQ